MGAGKRGVRLCWSFRGRKPLHCSMYGDEGLSNAETPLVQPELEPSPCMIVNGQFWVCTPVKEGECITPVCPKCFGPGATSLSQRTRSCRDASTTPAESLCPSHADICPL